MLPLAREMIKIVEYVFCCKNNIVPLHFIIKRQETYAFEYNNNIFYTLHEQVYVIKE